MRSSQRLRFPEAVHHALRLETNVTPGWIEHFTSHNGLKRFNHVDFLRRRVADWYSPPAKDTGQT